MKKSLAAFICIGLTACTEPENKRDKMEIRISEPITIAVGDTCPLIVVSRTITGATGRTSTTNPYVSFGLAIGDSTVAGVVNLQKIVGRVRGVTAVVAKDEKSNLVSDSVRVNVVPKP